MVLRMKDGVVSYCVNLTMLTMPVRIIMLVGLQHAVEIAMGKPRAFGMAKSSSTNERG